MDLEKDLHRIAARKISEQNNFEKRFSKNKSERGDTSQKGTWDNFRNETFNKDVLQLNSQWFNHVPQFGKLRFDYVSSTRQGKAVKPMSDRRFKALLARLQLHQVELIRLWYSEHEYLVNKKHEEEVSVRSERALRKTSILERLIPRNGYRHNGYIHY